MTTKYFIIVNKDDGGITLFSDTPFNTHELAQRVIDTYKLKNACIVAGDFPEIDKKLYSVKMTNNFNGMGSYLIVDNETKWTKSLAIKFMLKYANWGDTTVDIVPGIDIPDHITLGFITVEDQDDYKED